jgi:hypothetical protein
MHAPGEVDGGNEPEACCGGGEREFGDIFIEICAVFIREKNVWHDGRLAQMGSEIIRAWRVKYLGGFWLLRVRRKIGFFKK